MRALTGSHNYNMDTPSSDLDYKYFVAPTFDDLYHGKQFSDSYTSETVDYTCHDIRKLADLFWKANLAYLEVLFSKELVVNDKNIAKIISLRNDIAIMNLPHLYDASIGMYHSKTKLLYKGTEGTQPLVDKFGYDTKQAMHSLRILNFLERFHANGFKNFENAFRYQERDIDKKVLLGIKHGSMKIEDFLKLSDNMYKSVVTRVQDGYRNHPTNERLNDEVHSLVKECVKYRFQF